MGALAESLIRVVSLPVIEEQLRELKESWEQRAQDAQSMVCTEDTVQDIKKARAEMRKEYEDAENQRKAAKTAYMAPWDRIEAAYKDCVKDAFTRADAAYKSKIAEVEDAQKAECENVCRQYFAEVCAVQGVEWLRYEQTGIKISLAEAKKVTPSGLFDKLSEFAARVACDVDSIAKMEHSAEVMAEYKGNGLSLAKSVKAVQDRHEAADRERKEAVARAEAKRREVEAVAKVESAVPALAPPVEAKPEPLLTVTFKATAAKSKLIELREFMKQRGIQYE